MKKSRQFCATIGLALMLTLSASAGQITTMDAEPAPTPAPSLDGQITTMNSEQAPSPAVDGQMQTPVQGADSLTEAALSLLQSVLPLF